MNHLNSILGLLALFCPTLLAVDSGGKPPEYPDIPAGQTRGIKATKGGKLPYWGDRPDMAKVMTATFIGGKGSEWLCAGGFQADGTIVLAGNVNGGEFGLGVAESVLGSDGARPPTATFLPATAKTAAEKPSWRRPDTTGFLVFTSPDLKQIKKVVRFPWLAGAITSMAIGKDGEIYLAGRPGDAVAALGGTQGVLEVAAEPTKKEPQCTATFVAKLSKDAGKVEWLFTAKGPSESPSVSLKSDGNVYFVGQDMRIVSAAGKTLSVADIPGAASHLLAVNPKDGTFIKGGEYNTGTGREPWRCPVLNVLEPDGKLRYQLYEWPSNYVVLDNCRQVSDTAVRLVTTDRDGNIFVVMWSDGGNSVATTLPTDIRRSVGTQGTGLNAAGAGATSFAYLVKLDPVDYQVLGWTMWCSRYNGKGNGAGVSTICQSDDGSFLFAGGSAWGLVQTSNKLANGEPGGSYITVLTPDLCGVRYSSCVPGASAAVVAGASNNWAIGSGSVEGKQRALFLCGAKAEEDVYGLVTRTPTVNALQSTFGGGQSDGYVVMLDLSAPVTKPQPKKDPPPRLNLARDAHPVGQKPRPPRPGEYVAPTPATYAFSDSVPRWNSADAEFRVADGSHWPNFAVGRPQSGSLDWSADGAKGAFTLKMARWAQSKGKQDRRVLGDLFTDEKGPELTFTVTSVGPRKTDKITHVDDKGRNSEREVTSQTLEATLGLGTQSHKITFQATFAQGLVVEKKTMEKLQINAYATVKGSQLGLKGDLASKEIDIRVSCQGIIGGAAATNAGDSKKKPK